MKRRRLLIALACNGALAPAGPVLAQTGGDVVITVRLDRGKLGAVPADGAVVWLPDVRERARPTAPPTVRQREKEFRPHVIAVRQGSVVEFPNDDRIHHNVFSRTPGAEFDLGLYRDGASRNVRFDRPGLVRVFCNIHAQMAANVMVLEDVPFAVTDGAGNARIASVPAGRHAVRVWHETSGETGSHAQVSSGGVARLEMTLDASRFIPSPHRDKHGLEYPKSSRDADRY